MIRGFAREALFMFRPLVSDAEADGIFPPTYFRHLQMSIENICDYMKLNRVETHYLAYDDLANKVHPPMKWVMTIGQGDAHYVEKYGIHAPVESIKYPEIYRAVSAKLPVDREATPRERLITVAKRVNAARKLIMKNYKIIVTFKGVMSKRSEGVMYFMIEDTSFNVKCYLGETEVDIIDFLGIPNANAPAYEWEVPTA